MSDQPLNSAWGQGADGKWYPPEQLRTTSAPSPWSDRSAQPDPGASSPESLWGPPPAATPAPPPAPWGWAATDQVEQPPASRSSAVPWIGVALAGLAAFAALAWLGGTFADEDVAIEASEQRTPTKTTELAASASSTSSTTTSTTTSTSTTTTSTTTTSTTSTTAPPPPTTAVPLTVPPPPPPPPAPTTDPPQAFVAPPAEGGGVYFANCDAARAAGAAPVYSGQPGYSSRLDRDGDGVGCE